MLLATAKFLSYDAAIVALVLGVGVRLVTALTTRIHDSKVRAVVAGAGLVLGSMAAYATNATGNIAIWPDLVVVGAVAAALVIGVDRTVIGDVFKFIDERFPGFWLPDPNSVGIGRSPATLYAKSKVAKARAVHGGNPPPPGEFAAAPVGLPPVPSDVKGK